MGTWKVLLMEMLLCQAWITTIAIALVLSRWMEGDDVFPNMKCEYSLEVPPVSVHSCYSRRSQNIEDQHEPVDIVIGKQHAVFFHL